MGLTYYKIMGIFRNQREYDYYLSNGLRKAIDDFQWSDVQFHRWLILACIDNTKRFARGLIEECNDWIKDKEKKKLILRLFDELLSVPLNEQKRIEIQGYKSQIVVKPETGTAKYYSKTDGYREYEYDIESRKKKEAERSRINRAKIKAQIASSKNPYST